MRVLMVGMVAVMVLGGCGKWERLLDSVQGYGVQQTMPTVEAFICPSKCAEAVARGMSAVEIATQCPKLDRDKDGVACYGD